jgi:hypothetical protein
VDKSLNLLDKRGATMKTTTMTKTATGIGSVSWLGTLSTSLASFLGAAWPKLQLDLGVRKHSKVFYTGCVVSRSARPVVMLVESDVYRERG